MPVGGGGKNPIFERYFKTSAMLTSKTFDDYKSIIFRKHQAMWDLLEDSKPSSVPTAELVERIGDKATHHVIWLNDEGTALRDSLSYRTERRGGVQTRRNESIVKGYLNQVHKALARLRSIYK